jgi:hypothetical protein
MDDIALLRILDSCHKDEVEEIHGIIQEGLESTKSRWLVNTLVDYYFHSRSLEALSIIKKLPGVQADVSLSVCKTTFYGLSRMQFQWSNH